MADTTEIEIIEDPIGVLNCKGSNRIGATHEVVYLMDDEGNLVSRDKATNGRLIAYDDNNNVIESETFLCGGSS